jgi:hypothetical protein
VILKELGAPAMVDMPAWADKQNEAALALRDDLSHYPWRQVTLAVRTLGFVSEADTVLVDESGTATTVGTPTAAAVLMLHLREDMVTPEHGSWLSAVVTLTREPASEIEVNVHYEYDERPQWHIEPDDLTYIEDLERHPRPEHEIPGWYPRRRSGPDRSGSPD